ncbi:MAG: matrixin family metalloprotease, partial [Planctomycetaceae bacterium]|nr:matrixin family metalloprotease [Planctomycetaceae bacterium]
GNIGIGTQLANSAIQINAKDGTARLVIEENSSISANRDLLDLRNNGAGSIVLTDTDSKTTVRTGQGAGNAYTIQFGSTANPQFQLNPDGSLTLGATPTSFVLDAAGNLTVAGTVSSPSSIALKENLVRVDTQGVLDAIDDLSILLWNYIADPDSVRHISPLAEEFFTAFHLGGDASHIAPTDLGGVAMAGVQALYEQISLQNEEIAYLSWLAGIGFGSPEFHSAFDGEMANVNGTVSTNGTTSNGASLTGVSSTASLSAWERILSGATVSVGNNGQLVLGGLADDDLIINGGNQSLIIGNSAFANVNSAFDSVRLQDDVIRMHFQDTSTRPGDSTNDWRIVINDEFLGGKSYFSIVDVETGLTPLRIDAGAPEFSLLVDAQGRLGLGTSSPQQNIHITSGDTPTIRLEQSANGSFGSSIWDLAGNEVNFFIQHVTNGNTVPFVVHANAPGDSLFIDAKGNLGFGTNLPGASAHVFRDDGNAQISVTEHSFTTALRELLQLSNVGGASIRMTDTQGAGVTWRTGVNSTDDFIFDLDSTTDAEFRIASDGSLTVGPDGASHLVLDAIGNLTIAGMLTQGSSYTIKENFFSLSAGGVLQRLESLPVYRWNYIDDGSSVQHLGPTAEDFYAAFGLGTDAQHIAASDMITVALAGLQGLMTAVADQGQQLEAISTTIGNGWQSAATWDNPSTPLPATIDLATVDSSQVVGTLATRISSWGSFEAFANAATNSTAVPEHSSQLVVHDLQDGETAVDGGSHGLYLASTGTDSHFVWQDQDPSTPDVTEIYYDFRSEGTFANQITSAQRQAAESALRAWEAASDATIRFIRNPSVDRSQIINLGVGDLSAFGFQGSQGGTLAVGGGIVTSGEIDTITNGVVWLDNRETWDAITGNGHPTGTYDAQTVFLHELGHALGLGHADIVAGVDVMDGIYRGEQTTFSAFDKMLIQTLYADAILGDGSGNGALVLLQDVVSNGDRTISANVAVGIDAVNGEVFGTDTLRLKENNTRIAFFDTSNDGSPNVSWQLTANSNVNGGQNYFAIDQQPNPGSPTGTSIFRILAGAPTDSLVIDTSSRIGLGTQSPLEDLHLVSGMTPTIRLGQDASQGFAAQNWDFGGSDLGFFLRNANSMADIFQIFSGAPTNSLMVASDGSVGSGLGAPAGRFHILRSDGTAQLRVEEASATTADRDLIVLENNGGVLIRFSNTTPPEDPPMANNPVIGVAQTATVNGDQVTFDYYIENLGSETLTNLSLPHHLDKLFASFESHLVVSPTLISGPGTILLNSKFNGVDNFDLFDTGTIPGTDGRTAGDPGSTLGVGETAHIRITVEVDGLTDHGLGLGNYSSQVIVSARDSVGGVVSDLSDSGTDPDLSGNNNPTDVGEDDPTLFTVTPNPVIGVASDVAVFGQQGGGVRLELSWKLENLGNVTLENIVLTDGLDAVFGAGNYLKTGGSSHPEVTVIGGGALTRNASYNGSSMPVVISSGSLEPGAFAMITAEFLVTVLTDQGLGLGVYSNQATATGEGPGAVMTSDLSDAGNVPDPNFNGDPTENGEDDPTVFSLSSSLGAAMTASVVGNQVTFDLFLETFGELNLTNLTLIDDLDSLFGVGNYSLIAAPSLLDDPGTIMLNAGFDGSADAELFAPGSMLASSDTAQISFTVSVHQIRNAGNGLGFYQQNVQAFAQTSFGMTVSDVSDNGTDPDPNGDGAPNSNGESDPTGFLLTSDAVVGVASQVSVSGTQVTIDLYLENLGGSTSSNLSLIDDLAQVFGAGNFSLVSAPVFIDDPGTLVLNGGFDGENQTELLSPGSTLAAGDTAQIRFVINIDTIANIQGLGTGVYAHQASVSGTDPNGMTVVDLSDNNTDPDNIGSDGDPTFPGLQDPPVDGEDDPNAVLIGNLALGAALQATVQGTLITLDYTIENLSDFTVSSIVVAQNLFSVFGFGNYSVVAAPVVISGPNSFGVQSAFDGTFSQTLVNGQSLAAGERVRIRFVINVTNVSDQGNGLGVYPMQFTVTGVGPLNTPLLDVSDAGLLTDENGNRNPDEAGENDVTHAIIGEEPIIGLATSATVTGH